MSSQKAYIYSPSGDRLAAAGNGFQFPPLPTSVRTGLSLSTGDRGLVVWDQDLAALFQWNGTAWQQLASGSGGGGSPETFPIGVTFAGPLPVALSAGTIAPFAFPAPAYTGAGPYNGMRIDFHDIVQLDMTMGLSAIAAGTYRFNFFHTYQMTPDIGALTGLPIYCYCEGPIIFGYDGAAGFTIPNFKICVRGSVEIPSDVFSPDGLGTITFDDTVVGTGYGVEAPVWGTIPFSLNLANCFTYSQRITATYIYAP